MLLEQKNKKGLMAARQEQESITRGARSYSSKITPNSTGSQTQAGGTGGQPPKPPSVSEVLANTDDAANNLLAPVHIAEDANAIIKSSHPATSILAQSGLVVQRQIEMMNIFLGFEQANRYIIMDPHGNHVGYMAEHDGGFGKALSRQAFRTHRPFTTHVFDREQKEVLRVCFAFHISLKFTLTRPVQPSFLLDQFTNPRLRPSRTSQHVKHNPILLK
jgi:hypothetical protein